MSSAICTLFEGHYDLGVGALINSLVFHGFKGRVVVGYRGRLPRWRENGTGEQDYPPLNHVICDRSVDDIEMMFVPLTTSVHLTNYKPDFMLDILSAFEELDRLFYLDPDICLNRSWFRFEEWASCGVTLCEDVAYPLSENHPRRVGWRQFFKTKGFSLKFKDSGYANGGFVGVSRAQIEFLDLWQRLQVAMADEIGSLSTAKLEGGVTFKSKGFFECFDCSDQDALNAAREAYDGLVSLLGREAMSFQEGVSLLTHALGQPKPWTRNVWKSFLQGFPPTRADKNFWRHQTPIQLYGKKTLMCKRLSIKLTSFLSRFYRRS